MSANISLLPSPTAERAPVERAPALIATLGDEASAAWRELEALLESARRAGRRIVTTNGCFDLLHPGHVHFLERARALGELLVVGVNSDDSVRRLKGPERPILGERERAEMLAALRPVDAVVLFSEATPVRLLEHLRPAVHCKGSSYTLEEMPEREIVRRHGGEVLLLPLREGYSTSTLLRRVRGGERGEAVARGQREARAHASLVSAGQVVSGAASELAPRIAGVAERVADALAAGQTVFVCGNGGSATDAQHFAAELVGRFQRDREPWRAVSLSSDPAVLTCIGNDYGFEWVFSRQLEGLGRKGDVLIAISTSGRSANVLNAARAAARLGIHTIALTGRGANLLTELADSALGVPSAEVDLIQQGHRAILHALCELVEAQLLEARAS